MESEGMRYPFRGAWCSSIPRRQGQEKAVGMVSTRCTGNKGNVLFEQNGKEIINPTTCQSAFDLPYTRTDNSKQCP